MRLWVRIWHIRATKQKNERKSEKFINVKVHRESKPLHRLFLTCLTQCSTSIEMHLKGIENFRDRPLEFTIIIGQNS